MGHFTFVLITLRRDETGIKEDQDYDHQNKTPANDVKNTSKKQITRSSHPVSLSSTYVFRSSVDSKLN